MWQTTGEYWTVTADMKLQLSGRTPAVNGVAGTGEDSDSFWALAHDQDMAPAMLALIEVEYQPLPAIASVDEALQPTEAPIQDYAEEHNIHRRLAYSFGDTDEALEQSEHVFEDVFSYAGSTHMAM